MRKNEGGNLKETVRKEKEGNLHVLLANSYCEDICKRKRG